MGRIVCVSLVLAAFASGLTAPALAEQPDLPDLERPIAVTQRSHPFAAAAHQQVSLDLADYGYVEEEYLVRGNARIFQWTDGPGAAPGAEGPYVTRILVRRPASVNDFSGAAIVEPMNPSTPVDLPIMWAHSHLQFMADGHAWVGITIKPNTIASLRRFDPDRYGDLAMPRPESWPGCGAEGINSWSMPTTPADETGLAWDMISQIGAMLKAAPGEAVLGRPADLLYMTGQSQTAGYARTYATVFARNVEGPDGRPLYDGYLYSGSPPWQVPLNQCAQDLPAGDPRLLTGPAGAPVIEVFAEGDMGTNIDTRRADSDAAPNLYRRYEIPGAPHVDPWEQRSFASEADMARATGGQGDAEPDCVPNDVTPSDFPVRHSLNAAWRALDRWVREGEPAPRASRLQLKPEVDAASFHPETAFQTDTHGNALGGVRSPHVDVPVTRWIGAKTSAFQCMFEGYQRPFDRETLVSLYGDSTAYAAAVRRSARALQTEGWLTPEDAAEIVEEAERFVFPAQ